VKKIKVGDEAIIIGSSGSKAVSAEEWGEWSGSFNYEITTRINSQAPRKLVK
jgi:alanine racemase